MAQPDRNFGTAVRPSRLPRVAADCRPEGAKCFLGLMTAHCTLLVFRSSTSVVRSQFETWATRFLAVAARKHTPLRKHAPLMSRDRTEAVADLFIDVQIRALGCADSGAAPAVKTAPYGTRRGTPPGSESPADESAMSAERLRARFREEPPKAC